MNERHKTVHIGPFPPPIGGISVYLSRLESHESESEYINECKLSKIDFIKLAFLKNKHFFYHSPNLKRRTYLYLVSLFTTNKFSFACHGNGLKDSFLKSNVFVKFLIVKTIEKSRSIQCVNRQIKEFILSISNIESNKLIVKSAFLPPDERDEKRIFETYPPSLIKFTNKNNPIIIGNAASLCFYDEGIDLYGLDMCIELIAMLKKEYPSIGLIFALADETLNANYLQKMKKKAVDLGINDNIYFMTGQKELWPLFKKADLMVRPTVCDGYGISIAEALSFGCSAVASDVSDRPEGTVLFRNRDINDFYTKCYITIQHSLK